MISKLSCFSVAMLVCKQVTCLYLLCHLLALQVTFHSSLIVIAHIRSVWHCMWMENKIVDSAFAVNISTRLEFGLAESPDILESSVLKVLLHAIGLLTIIHGLCYGFWYKASLDYYFPFIWCTVCSLLILVHKLVTSTMWYNIYTINGSHGSGDLGMEVMQWSKVAEPWGQSLWKLLIKQAK